MSWNSGDRLTLLWNGGLTNCIYADHRHGGRIIVDTLEGPQLMNQTELGVHSLRAGEGAPWGTPLDKEYDRLLGLGLVDDTAAPTQQSGERGHQ